jgi:glycosyltransferase involved in cell wall biosynthesis
MSASIEPEISVVIPVFNEAESIGPLVREIVDVLGAGAEPPHGPYEIVVVDDGSTDGTDDVLAALAGEIATLQIVRHATNCGQSAGQATGFARARGRVIVTLDGDGQNDPADIPALIEALAADVDCVCGVRQVRQDDLVRRVSSRVANRFRDAVTGDRVADSGCALRAIRRSALDELLVFNGMHRFLASILRFQGYRVVELPVNHRPRTAGTTKYGVGNRLFRGIRDCFALRWYRARALQAKRLADE